jgi:sulfite reductase beta subunit-like hemoprotein
MVHQLDSGDQMGSRRNVLATSLPELSHLHQQAYDFAKALSERLLPRTNAYHEIWLDKKQVAGDAVKDVEPIYGAYYLPRKVRCSSNASDATLTIYRFTVQNGRRYSSQQRRGSVCQRCWLHRNRQ